MHFNRILLLAAASFAVAAPEPRPDPVAMPAPQSTGLLSELPGILTGAEDLLSQQNINNLQTIIGNAAKLLSDSNLDLLQDILTNAHGLLTKEFVDNTTTLIGDATPVCIPLRVDRDDELTLDVARGGRVEAAGRGAGNLVKGHELMTFIVFNDRIRDQSRDYYTIFHRTLNRCTERIFMEWVYTRASKQKRTEKKRKMKNDQSTNKARPGNLNHVQFVTQTILVVAQRVGAHFIGHGRVHGHGKAHPGAIQGARGARGAQPVGIPQIRGQHLDGDGTQEGLDPLDPRGHVGTLTQVLCKCRRVGRNGQLRDLVVPEGPEGLSGFGPGARRHTQAVHEQSELAVTALGGVVVDTPVDPLVEVGRGGIEGGRHPQLEWWMMGKTVVATTT